MPVIRARGMSVRYAGRLGAKALDRAPEPILEADPRIETDQLAGAAHVQEALRLTVWLGCIPHRLAVESDEPRDGLGEVTNPRLLPSADVHGLGRFEALCSKEQRTGC